MVGCGGGPGDAGNADAGAAGSLAGVGGSVLTPRGGASGGAAGRAAGAAGNSPRSPTPSAGSAARDASDPQGAQDDDAGVAADAGGDGAASPPAADAAPAESTGPGDWGPGDYPEDITAQTYLEISGVPGQGSHVRQYKVHVPPSYRPEVPAPLVFCIHGLGQDAVLFCVTGAAMHTKSDAAGFILVMPNGYANSWNAGTCCGDASTEQLDEVSLFRAIFAEVGKHVNIDLNRVYATGLSNGGYMSYRLACEAADIFTAVAPAAAAIGKNDIGGGTNTMSNFTSCEPSRPVSVLHVHGTADPLIAYDLQAPSIAHMQQKNGCGTTSQPASRPSSGGDTTCISYAGCPAGIELTACTIEEGGHCWFGSPDCGTGGGAIGMAIVGANSDTMNNTDAIWDFFEPLSR